MGRLICRLLPLCRGLKAILEIWLSLILRWLILICLGMLRQSLLQQRQLTAVVVVYRIGKTNKVPRPMATVMPNDDDEVLVVIQLFMESGCQ